METFKNCDTVVKWGELAIGDIRSRWNLSSKADKPNLAIHNAFENLWIWHKPGLLAIVRVPGKKEPAPCFPLMLGYTPVQKHKQKMKPTLLPVLFSKFLACFFFLGVITPVCSYNKPIDYFSVCCSSLCTGTNGVTPVDFCCQAAVLQILWYLIKIDLCIVCLVFPLVSPTMCPSSSLLPL